MPGLAVIQDLSLSTSADLDGIATDLTIDLEATNVALAADATLAVATGKTLTVTSTAGTDYQLDVSAIASGSGGVFTVDGDISVSSETTLKSDGSAGDDGNGDGRRLCCYPNSGCICR